ncbi:unnamed protein product, partial [Ixodes pacificus]
MKLPAPVGFKNLAVFHSLPYSPELANQWRSRCLYTSQSASSFAVPFLGFPRSGYSPLTSQRTFHVTTTPHLCTFSTNQGEPKVTPTFAESKGPVSRKSRGKKGARAASRIASSVFSHEGRRPKLGAKETERETSSLSWPREAAEHVDVAAVPGARGAPFSVGGEGGDGAGSLQS